jgi:hypothetical protein
MKLRFTETYVDPFLLGQHNFSPAWGRHLLGSPPVDDSREDISNSQLNSETN